MARLNYPDIGGGGGAPSPLTTKGDLYSHDGSSDVRLPTGANGEFLRANTAEEEGLEWDTIDDDAIKPALNAGGDAPIYAARAWVNFDGTTTPPTIRASGNVSSVVRNAVGDYTVNFSTAMPDTNYSVGGSAQINFTGNFGRTLTPGFSSVPTTTSLRVATSSAAAASPENCVLVNVQVFR